MSYERWFTEEELEDMTLPTIDRILAALEAKEYDQAAALAKEMRHEWRLLHDALVEFSAALLTYIGKELGEEKVGDSLRFMVEKTWRDSAEKIAQKGERRAILRSLAATWRAHSTSGVGPDPGSFQIVEDEEKFTFFMAPCGSGHRLWRRGMHEPPKSYGMTTEPREWAFGREGLPYYCAHCSFMNESLPIEWSGAPLYPLDPPQNPNDSCTWYFYKDPWAAPSRFWERYGKNKEEERAKRR